jgi:tRNA1Val (adenine37-N6)-methyltransferase
MANSWFQFRHFTVYQDACAMKVTTEACLFGAWVPVAPGAKNILDIGAGTGLLSLMLAQRIPYATITAVEIDSLAAKQAAENAAQSPFAQRIRLVHQSIQDFAAGDYTRFDLVISNPPFFNRHLASPHQKVNMARHQQTLLLEDLAELLPQLLNPSGQIAVLLPPAESIKFCTEMARYGFNINQLTLVKNRPGADVFRHMMLFGRHTAYQESQLLIRESDGQYNAAFRQLLSPFYLTG